MIQRKIYIIILMFLSLQLFSQSPQYPPDEYYYYLLDRFMVKYPETKNDIHASLKYYNIDDINAFLLNIDPARLRGKNEKDYQYLLVNNVDWLVYKDSSFVQDERVRQLNAFGSGIRGLFYKSKSSFLTLAKPDFFLKADPVVHFALGKDFANNDYGFINTRGFKISGLLDKKIYFYTSLFETQRNYPRHLQRKIKRDHALPGQGFFKPYRSGIFDSIQGYDFLNAQAYIGFLLTKHLNIQLGHGRFFIGNGIRSLFLSAYAHNYYYLRFDTRIWKFHYTNIFAELTAGSRDLYGIDILLPKKYMASHYLNFKFNNRFQAGIFESVIFHRKNYFEFQYLNPVIIYRTVEQFTGSSDNVLVGLDLKYDAFNGFSVYGQLLLDEFNFAILKNNDGWWANKYGLQLGIKYFDIFGIDHLDLQLEGNMVRPYTYSHSDTIANYSHYNQALAHPLGANFKEAIAVLRYSGINNLYCKAKAVFALKGEDPGEVNYGGNILKSTELRPHDSDGNPIDYGYYTGAGIKHHISQYSLEVSYILRPGYYLDFDLYYRKESFDELFSGFDEMYAGAGLRININKRNEDF